MSTRSLIISITDSPLVKSFFEKQGMKSPLVRRFIAGVSLREALLVVKELEHSKIHSTLDFLGENVITAEEATRATDSYLDVIRQITIFSPDASISVKLTALGLDASTELAKQNLRRLTDEAASRGGVFIRVDMEGSAYTSRTLQIVIDEHRHYAKLGTVIQSYLRRSDKDIETLNEEGISIRLVKGAYAESESVAFPKKQDVDSAFRKQMYLLLEKGYRPAIATHDEEIITIARRFIKQKNIPIDRFEFEMLMGIRRDIQDQLVKDGLPVRVYIPFGYEWYPYFTRRIAERPANLFFILRQFFRG